MMVSSLPCKAQEHVFGFFDFPPFIYLDHQSKAQGIIVEQILQPISVASGHSFSYKRYPAKRYYAELMRGTIDFSAGGGAPGTRGIVHQGSKLVFSINIMLFSRRPLNAICSIADLKGQRLGGIRGFEFSSLLQQVRDPTHNIHYQMSNSRNSLYRLLIKGRIDYVIDYYQPAVEHLRANSLPKLEQLELTDIPVYFIVSKAKPGGLEFLQELESLLDIIGVKGGVKGSINKFDNAEGVLFPKTRCQR